MSGAEAPGTQSVSGKILPFKTEIPFKAEIRMKSSLRQSEA